MRKIKLTYNQIKKIYDSYLDNNFFDECLNEHLNVYFHHLYQQIPTGFYSKGKKNINEEHGQIPNIVEYYNCFGDALFGAGVMDNHQKKQDYHFKKDIFSTINNTFFNNIDIFIQLTIDKDIKNGDYEGGYYPSLSKFYTINDEKTCDIVININVKTNNIETALTIAGETFSHEITHAYEDFKRFTKNKESLTDYMKRTKYNQEVLGGNYEWINEFVRKWVMMDKIEQNAQIGQLKSWLKDFDLKNEHDAFNVLKHSLTYLRYQDLCEYTYWLYNNKDANIRNGLIVAFNKNSTKKVNTYEKMLIIWLRTFRRYQRKLLNTLSKVAYDVYQEQNKNKII